MPGQYAHRLKIHLSDPIRPGADELLTLEFAFVTMDDSCKDLYSLDGPPSLDRFCRRMHDHKGKHACGFGDNRVQW